MPDLGKTMVDAAMGEIFPVCEKLCYTIVHRERDLRPQGRASGLLPQCRSRDMPRAKMVSLTKRKAGRTHGRFG